MPYIEESDRKRYDFILKDMAPIENKGQLEYCISYLQKLFMRDKEWRYATLHEAVYAAQHCGDEFRRRYLDPREENAKNTKGDVLPAVKPPWEV